VLIILHNCCTQHSTEKFWLASTDRQTDKQTNATECSIPPRRLYGQHRTNSFTVCSRWYGGIFFCSRRLVICCRLGDSVTRCTEHLRSASAMNTQHSGKALTQGHSDHINNILLPWTTEHVWSRPTNLCQDEPRCQLILLLQLFYDPLSRTTWVSRYQKDKPFWILLKQRWWGGSGTSLTICKLFALCSRR